jgi:hypothetical protein
MLTLLPCLKASNMQQHVYDLVPQFADTGPTDVNITGFHDCYKLFLELARNTASEVGCKKFGYMRSPTLTLAGRTLNAYIMLLDCKTRNSSPSPALLRICSSLDLDAMQILSTTDKHTLCRRVRDCRATLWSTQKNCEELHYEWLEKTAQDRARAADNPDWEKKLTRMKRTVLENATNRKLSFVTKDERVLYIKFRSLPAHGTSCQPRQRYTIMIPESSKPTQRPSPGHFIPTIRLKSLPQMPFESKSDTTQIGDYGSPP